MSTKGCEHCWHETGTLITDGVAERGTTECTCCNCGARESIAWRMGKSHLPGHGPHVTRTKIIYHKRVTDAKH